jgi:hypothetical protein
MDAHDYLDRVLELYAPTFDIERPREAGGICFDAYGFFSSMSEKYVLVEDAKLWTVNTFEHAFFLVADSISADDIAEVERLIEGPLQSGFVTKGKRYPGNDHLRSLITVVLISRNAVGRTVSDQLERFRFDKSYLFTLRGYCEGRLIAVELENKKVYASKAASKLKRLYEEVLKGEKDRR